VSSRRTIETCAALERRAAALAWKASSSVRRSENARAASLAGIVEERTKLESEPAWSAARCAALHLRAKMCHERAANSSAEAQRHRAAAAEQLAVQRSWGRIRRGLERRVERRESLALTSWPD
jgi:hypothetical protein